MQTSAGMLQLEIAGITPDSQHDVLVVTSDADIAGTIELMFLDSFAPHAGDEFALLDIGGVLDDTTANYVVRNLEPGFEFDIVLDGQMLTMTAVNDGVFVPEPSTFAIIVLGLLVLLSTGHRRTGS
jgi:hypothetical protein